MIGIVDYDFYLASKYTLGFPSLEAMKMTVYEEDELHKKCYLIMDFSNLDRYDEIFFFSRDSKVTLPPALAGFPNLNCFGPAFQGEEYVPFSPFFIEYFPARVALYKPYLRQYYIENPNQEKNVMDFLHATYLRLNAGDENLPLPAIERRKKVYIYDQDFLKYDGWRDQFAAIEEHKPSAIRTLYPVKCRSIEQFLAIRSFSKFSTENDVILDVHGMFETPNAIVRPHIAKLLQYIEKTSNVYIYIGKNYYNNNYDSQFVLRNMLMTLNILYFFWSCRLPVKLMYFRPQNTRPSDYDALVKKIAAWSIKACETKTIEEVLTKELTKIYEGIIALDPKKQSLFLVNRQTLFQTRSWSYE